MKKPKRILIHVTEDDIRRGVRQQEACCPVALACQRAFKESANVTADRIELPEWKGERGPRNFTPPFVVRSFVRRFDAYEPVKPFSFEIDLEEP